MVSLAWNLPFFPYSSFPTTWFVYATTSNVFQTSFTYLSLEFLFPIEPYTHAIISYIGYGFSYGHVWMWELDCEEGWVSKNWCFWTVVLEKTLESPLDCKEIQPVHSEGDLPWDLFGRNETPGLWPPHVKSWLIGKDPDGGRDWGQEEKGTIEDEMAGWHH